ncbi:MAG TPA: Gfo/Idh/MocA family oxidoreductase [Sphingomicrobium sp.]|nr:Gfo/Idh/MocA family oxidoreductase [Sphingomicrobium sp.]
MKLGFLGVGWIGRNRMEAMLATGKAEAIAICDPNPDMAGEGQKLAPEAALVSSLDELLALAPDGVVIATPSALHAEQSIAALNAGAAVFCQKPLGRNATEVEAVLDAARKADRPLGVDLSYRHTAAMQAIRDLIRSDQLGHVFAADLVFHNAYGPGNAWFYDPKLSGGGCLIDLGVHLVDLALWLFDFPEVVSVHGRILKEGRAPAADEVEDFALGEIELANGTTLRIACSWNLSAGQDADIRATFYGTHGGAEMRNENGSFFDFVADRFSGRNRERIAGYPDAWGGRAAAEWVEKLASGERFEGSTTGLVQTAQVLDRLYGR